MSEQTKPESELAGLIVEALNLEDVEPADIDPEAQLFGGDLGLDSIDALEISLAVSKRYNVQLRADATETREAFANLRALAAHIESQLAA